MIPLLVILKIRNQRRHNFRLWVPLFLLWLVLLPVVLVLLPLFVIGCLIVAMNPFRALLAFWQVLTGLRGMHLEVDSRDSQILIRII
jgi:uncharacterized integral membrane protein